MEDNDAKGEPANTGRKTVISANDKKWKTTSINGVNK